MSEVSQSIREELEPTLPTFREANGTPLQYSCLENPMDGGAWWAAVHGVAKSRTWLHFHFHFSLSCSGEGNGNPLQCSCLENPRDQRAWWAAFYGVAQSWTRLKRLSSYPLWKRGISKNLWMYFKITTRRPHAPLPSYLSEPWETLLQSP